MSGSCSYSFIYSFNECYKQERQNNNNDADDKKLLKY